MNTTTKIAAFGILAASLMTIAVVSIVPAAEAKITQQDTSCTNPGGTQPGGQQPSCRGSGLTQQTENQNPSGSAPPGQNK